MAGMVRVYLLPSWWQDSQLSVLIEVNPLALLLMLGEMPLPGAGARKFVLGGDFKQGVPIIRRIILRGGFRIGRDVGFRSTSLPGSVCTLGESTSP